jgi:DNA-binding transcriptional regulator YiaG
MEPIARVVKRVRMTLEMSATEFAAALGVCEYSVRKWESGIAKPSLKTLRRMRDIAPRQFKRRLTAAVRNYSYHRRP